MTKYLTLFVMLFTLTASAQDGVFGPVQQTFGRRQVADSAPTTIPRYGNSMVWYRNTVFTNSAGKRPDASAAGTNVGSVADGGAMPTHISAAEGLSYDGGDYALIGNKILNGATSFTMSVWHKVSTYSTRFGIFAWRHVDTNTFGFGKATATTYPKLSWMAANIVGDFNNGAATNSWIHLCSTWSSNTGTRVYVNGILTMALPTELKGSVIWQGDVMRSGWDDYSSDRYYYGGIDDELIYNVELSSNEVFTLFGLGH